MKLLQQALRVHELSLERYGGLPGIRDEGLLISAISQPFKGIGDEDFYPEVHEKAAVLMYGIIANHPFLDGNKRTGLGLGLAFLKVEGVEVMATDDELYNFTIAIASGQMDIPAIAAWLKKNTRA